MGPCGFIPVRLIIFRLYLGASIPLFKLLMGKWFRSLCTGLVDCLSYTMVYLIVVSVWLTVSVLKLFPSGVVIHLDYASILSTQLSKYFSVPALIVLLNFCSIFRSRQLFFLQFFQFYCSHLVELFCSQLYSYFLIKKKISYDLPDNFPDDLLLSHFVSSVGLYYHYW